MIFAGSRRDYGGKAHMNWRVHYHPRRFARWMFLPKNGVSTPLARKIAPLLGPCPLVCNEHPTKSIVVQVQVGLADQLHILPERTLLYNELHEIKSFDAASKEGKTVLAVVTSSGSSPNELYSIVDGQTVPLSNHGADIAKLDIATAEPFYAKAQDGTDLDGILVLPKDHDASKP
jgi:dipeptidyl aminopeptidase/acylaminoacyl peptidase